MAYLYYVIQENGFEGWVAGPDKGNDNTFVIKILNKYDRQQYYIFQRFRTITTK